MSHKAKQTADSQFAQAVIRENNISLSELKSKLTAKFAAPVFDQNAFAAPLMAKGIDFLEIAKKVNDARKKFEKDHPAPACNLSIVKDMIKKSYSDDFTKLTGANINDVDGILYNDNGTPCKTTDDDMTANGIITAVFSYRFKIAFEQRQAKINAERRSIYYDALFNFIAAAKKLGIDREGVISEVSSNWNYYDGEISKTAAKIRRNIDNMWEMVNSLERQALCYKYDSAKRNKIVADRRKALKDITTLQKLLE